MLPGACHFDYLGWALGRCQPMYYSREMHYHHVIGYTVCLAYLWRTSSLLNNLLLKVCFGLSVGFRLCGIWQYQGREFNVGFALYILLSSTMGFIFVRSL